MKHSRILAVLAAGSIITAGSMQALDIDFNTITKTVNGVTAVAKDIPPTIESVKSLVTQIRPLIDQIQNAPRISGKMDAATHMTPLIVDLLGKLSIVVKDIGNNIVSIFDQNTASKMREALGMVDSILGLINATNRTLQETIATIKILENLQQG